MFVFYCFIRLFSFFTINCLALGTGFCISCIKQIGIMAMDVDYKWNYVSILQLGFI